MECVLEKSGRLNRFGSATSSSGLVTIQLFEPNMKVTAEKFPGKLFQVSSGDESMFTMKRYNIGISNMQIIEFISDIYNPTHMTTMDCHSMDSLVKVNFKRGSVITFHFRSGVTKKYMMFDCVECVSTIKNIMAQSGKSATHSSRKYSLNVANAQNLLDIVRSLEEQFSINPTHSLVITLMDHLREAVECFGEANDPRYEEVIAHIQNFLQRADVIALLDPPPPTTTLPPSDVENISPPRNSSLEARSSSRSAPASKKGHSSDEFTESSVALMRELSCMMDSWSEADAEDGQLEAEAEETTLAVENQAVSAVMSGTMPTAPWGRRAKRDSLELSELNDMLGDMSAELESIVGTVGHTDPPRKLTVTSRASSVGSCDLDFESFLASLEDEVEAEITYGS